MKTNHHPKGHAMQIKSHHKNVYKLYAYARTQECLDAYRKGREDSVRQWETLKAEGVCDRVCKEFTGISRATYYRYKAVLKTLEKGRTPPSKKPKKLRKPKWGEAEKQLVLRIRRENPTYGKEKISLIIGRDFDRKISISTVGRILKFLSEKGLLTKSSSAPRAKRKRNFGKNHAQPWTYKKYAEMEMGERVQIDHMTVTKNGICIKHFKAWERRSKYIHAQAYSNAKATSARKFLLEFIETAPFKIKSVQVDGGSEFMAEFEQTCQEKGIPLIVLPPAKPKYNGGVERGNRVFREEFYARTDMLADSLGALRAELKAALNKYNTYRPHKSLDGLTPMAYIEHARSA
jgi:transposase InsO family protein